MHVKMMMILSTRITTEFDEVMMRFDDGDGDDEQNIFGESK